MKQDYGVLVREAEQQPFSGWDFSYLHGRYIEAKPSWDYFALVRERMKSAKSMLDLGTGGGERLASLQPFPKQAFATEGYPPNVILAKKRLEPLGVSVVEAKEESVIPFEDGFFDLVIDRHTGFDAKEVFRILKHGGRFMTQQVGDLNDREIREFFQGKKAGQLNLDWFASAIGSVEDTGLHVLVIQFESRISAFRDVGALIYYLKAIPWEVPDFSVERYESKLREVHRIIQSEGAFEVTTSRLSPARKWTPRSSPQRALSPGPRSR
jgi:SAM-dependent methyltransferase